MFDITLIKLNSFDRPINIKVFFKDNTNVSSIYRKIMRFMRISMRVSKS